jgi:4-amino-4-deoxy-L-arabinose transferase-like glycosyltransferase
MTEPEGPDGGPARPARALRARLDVRRIWRSPPDQPSWARPALLVITALAVFGYAWGIGSVTLEPFYGAAARSMSESWHNFVFGAFDPWGTVSVDKLPGALWVQALSLRLFGFHLWAIVLPQIVEGAMTVLVLYRAVRRVSGPVAGLIAAAVLAVSPVTILLNRGNISDSVFILLLVLAADATTKAMTTGPVRSLAWAGLWVGLAFQAKMVQAWLVLPAFFVAYLIAAPTASLLRRLRDVALCALVVAVVSLSFMTAVTLVPSHDRPYVDGSCNDSLYAQVFVYNGLDRFNATVVHQTGCSSRSPFLADAGKLAAAQGFGTVSIRPGWHRLLLGAFGRDDAWVLVPAVVAAIGLLAFRRRRPRTDPLRAATTMWTTWLVFTWAFFSVGRYLNSYYLAALVPALAALCGFGGAWVWAHRGEAKIRLVVLLTVVASTAYALALVPAHTGLRGWIIAGLVIVSALAVTILAASLRPEHASLWSIWCGLGLASVALLSGSAFASGTAVVSGEGPFDTPYQPATVTYLAQTLPGRDRPVLWAGLNRYARSMPPSQAADVFESSYLASYDIFATGREFLSVGGFSGQVPVPSLPQFEHDVADGKIVNATAAVKPRSHNPDMIWVIAHCRKVRGDAASYPQLGAIMQRYICASVHAHRAERKVS